MVRKIVWTEKASGDIEAIFRYIARRDPGAAARIGFGIYDRAQILLEHPEAGTILDELRDGDWRKLIFRRWENRLHDSARRDHHGQGMACGDGRSRYGDAALDLRSQRTAYTNSDDQRGDSKSARHPGNERPTRLVSPRRPALRRAKAHRPPGHGAGGDRLAHQRVAALLVTRHLSLVTSRTASAPPIRSRWLPQVAGFGILPA